MGPDWWGGSPEFYYSRIEDWHGSGNIDADPLFVDPDGPDDATGTLDDNLRLLPDSPCIDAGDPDFWPGEGATDLDGHARVLCDRVDMGAYESGIGDYYCDGSVDLSDFANWGACMTGPDGGPCDEACVVFDFDADTDVDVRDYALFSGAFSGP
jgi:hypothetical protein